MDQSQLLSLLKPEAEKIDNAMREDLQSIRDALLSEIVHYALFNGGKRIRPLLCVLAANLCGRQDDSLYRLAMSFEYLHVATLLHDDVIDHAATRRGRESANTIWGNIPAILAGDFLHARSMFLVGDLGGRNCLEIICRATAAMVEGEFLQLRNTRNFTLSEEDYFKAIDGKTGVLIAAVCELGAVYAKADRHRQEALRLYGAELGLAFQVVDDLLDYLGDSQKTGKTVGNDFIEAKMTLPLIHALTHGNKQDRGRLLALLAGDKENRSSNLPEAVMLIEKYGSFQYAKQRAGQLIDAALARLENFADDTAGPYKPVLQGLARYVLTREK